MLNVPPEMRNSLLDTQAFIARTALPPLGEQETNNEVITALKADALKRRRHLKNEKKKKLREQSKMKKELAQSASEIPTRQSAIDAEEQIRNQLKALISKCYK